MVKAPNVNVFKSRLKTLLRKVIHKSFYLPSTSFSDKCLSQYIYLECEKLIAKKNMCRGGILDQGRVRFHGGFFLTMIYSKLTMGNWDVSWS